MNATNMSSFVSDEQDCLHPSFIEYLEEETGLHRVYLGLIVAFYILVAILLLLSPAWGIHWQTKSTREVTGTKNLKRFSTHGVFKQINLEDSRTENLEDYYGYRKNNSVWTTSVKDETISNVGSV